MPKILSGKIRLSLRMPQLLDRIRLVGWEILKFSFYINIDSDIRELKGLVNTDCAFARKIQSAKIIKRVFENIY